MSNAYGTTYYRESYNNKELQENLKYKKKYKKLKNLIKEMVVVWTINEILTLSIFSFSHLVLAIFSQENAALCDQVSQVQDNLIAAKKERLTLLKRLCQLQGEIDPSTSLSKSQVGSASSPVPNCDTVLPKKSIKKRNSVETPGSCHVTKQNKIKS